MIQSDPPLLGRQRCIELLWPQRVRGREIRTQPLTCIFELWTQGWYRKYLVSRLNGSYLYLSYTLQIWTLLDLTSFSVHALYNSIARGVQCPSTRITMPPNRVHALLRLLFVTCATLVCGQECYYPNGNPTLGPDAPCNDGTGNCCPLNWECLDNGLCYLPNQGYFQRTTCTSSVLFVLFATRQKTNSDADRYRPKLGPNMSSNLHVRKDGGGQ